MYAFLRVSRGVSRHDQSGGCRLYVVRDLCRQGNFAVDIAFQTDGHQFVGIGGEIFAFYLLAVAQVAVAHDGGVHAETAVVVADST